MGHDVVLAEIAQQLAGNLVQSFFGKHVWVVLEIVEGHELHDVRSSILPVCLRVERLVVSVKHFHVAEVCITHANDDDSKREVGSFHDLVNCCRHIGNDSISDQQEN